MNAHFRPPRIHLLVSDLYRGDAIGNFVSAVRRMLLRRGFDAPVYAERYDDVFTDVLSYEFFFATVRSSDVLFYQLSNRDPALPAIMAVPCRKVVYYHNITPGIFFAPYSLETAASLEAGRADLSLVGSADALLANSRYSLAEVSSCLPPAVPRAFFPPFLAGQLLDITLATPPKDKMSSAFPFPYLLALGRVVPHKRIEDAIRIFAVLHDAKPDLRLVIAGSHYEPYVETLKQMLGGYPGLSTHVIFTGKLFHEDVPRFLCNAAALLHASAHEGFCMPALEAMLANIPVFANSQEAVSETLGGTGVLFDARNPREAAEHIINNGFALRRRKQIIAAQRQRAKKLCALADEDTLLNFLSGPSVHKRRQVLSLF